MKKAKRPLLIITLFSFTFSSCGVIFGGSKYSGSIVVRDHPDAEIYVHGSKIGTGSAIGLYRRNTPLIVEVRQDGCESKTQHFDYTFRTGNFIASLLTWGLVGVLVDLGTGASYKPDHASDPGIQRLSDKNYIFTVDYSGCTSAQAR